MFRRNDEYERQLLEAKARDILRHRRAELLHVAAMVSIERADVIKVMGARHADKVGAPAAELHALYDEVAADMAVARARALIAAVDKETD